MLPLLLALLAPPDLRLETVRESLTGTHCRYRVYVEGLPSDDVLVRRCDVSTARVTAHAIPEETHERWLDGRRVRRSIVYDSPLEPYAEDVDVATGALVRRIPLFYRAKAARVFDVNPVVATNDPTLQDRNDSAAAVPSFAYRDVVLQDVEESGPLRGPYASLIDRQTPTIAPPDASGPLVFDREQDGFEDVHAYFHVDRNQRYVQSLGYVGSRAIAPYAIEIDAHATSGTDNSFFLPSLIQIGRGTLFFGEGGTDDAEDADLLIHEYGHALLEWIAPGTFGGANVSEARALGEGFGDYWAFSAHAGDRVLRGRDPFCFADWDARCWEDAASQQCSYAPGSDCLRRLDGTATMADYERVSRTGVEHQNGMIWSSALREIHMAVGKTVADTIILESNFDVPAQPTYATMARLLLRADQQLYGGAHAAAICSAMTKRQILTECGREPRGELTLFTSNERNIDIADLATITSTITVADPRAIERVQVRIDLRHEARGDLQLQLIAPDGTTVLLQSSSSDRGIDIHFTYDDPALDVLRGRGAAGIWTLRISDQRARDVGTLLSWNLQLQLESDVRAAERPRAQKTQMIPVVAHLFGANDTAFRSDVRLANTTNAAVRATLIFTPSGSDGRTTFAAVDVRLAAGQTAAFDDIVDSAFGMNRSGSLEILGDVVATSRMTTNDVMGQQVPANLTTGPLLLVASFNDLESRVNLGLTETSGERASVRIGDRKIVVEPYSHVQFNVPPGLYAIEADGNLLAYLSQVNDRTGDAMFIPAERSAARGGIAPAIARQGADRVWRSDLWLAGTSEPQPLTVRAIALGSTYEAAAVVLPPFRVQSYIDALGRLFDHRVTFGTLQVPLQPGLFAATRVATDGMSQFIPLQDPNGPAEQQLLFIDTVAPYRTNIGITTELAALAEVTLFDAAGTELERFTLATAGGVSQTSVARALTNGRARVRFVSGTGRAYASLVDSRSGDATFVAGQ
ncbi:MAG TPA: proprotein convertase P-domain-containing protein [Thermoanaerobaculia bacterium]|nr:proprotein convertase P-domain-containing protein [Thermoanaerobaculia bacterium]